jgi:AcrR family transcriptional regulator
LTEREESQAIPRVLPRGRHGLDSSVVRASQRLRLVEAMTEECAEKGYAKTTVADVIERSGISRKTFYEHFKNKEDCFLQAYIDGHDKLREDITKRMSAASDWREALEFALRGYVESLATRPAFTRIFATEALAAGGRVREERDRRFEIFIDFYRELARRARAENPELPHPSDEIVVAAIGAIAELVRYTVAKRGPKAVAELYEPIHTVVWTLVIGEIEQKEALAE